MLQNGDETEEPPADKLYFWELASILSDSDIESIVRDFYTRVWSDPQDWFRTSFTDVACFDNALWAQTMMWIDSFGGGRAYHGGAYRLNFHHHRVHQVMNEEGGKRWMMLMRQTLDSHPKVLQDPRIRPAIDDFLKCMMQKYAREFYFDDKEVMCEQEERFDEKTYPQPQTYGSFTLESDDDCTNSHSYYTTEESDSYNTTDESDCSQPEYYSDCDTNSDDDNHNNINGCNANNNFSRDNNNVNNDTNYSSENNNNFETSDNNNINDNKINDNKNFCCDNNYLETSDHIDNNLETSDHIDNNINYCGDKNLETSDHHNANNLETSDHHNDNKLETSDHHNDNNLETSGHRNDNNINYNNNLEASDHHNDNNSGGNNSGASDNHNDNIN